MIFPEKAVLHLQIPFIVIREFLDRHYVNLLTANNDSFLTLLGLSLIGELCRLVRGIDNREDMN